MTIIKYCNILSSWKNVFDACRTTIGLPETDSEKTSDWKRSILRAEHSPIRQIIIKWKWTSLKYWISVHFVRHKFGIEHYVKTQRSDRTDTQRDDLPQSALVDHECIANAQAIIYISRKRLCNHAATETRTAWQLFLESLKNKEPELFSICVPECVYRGFCPEPKSCGFTETNNYAEKLEEYRRT
jgi:hypothetical protein